MTSRNTLLRPKKITYDFTNPSMIHQSTLSFSSIPRVDSYKDTV